MATLTKLVYHSKKCKNCDYFEKITLFTKLSNEDVQIFSEASSIKNYKKGENLYVNGAKADYFYIICSGWVKLFQTTEYGEEVNLGMLAKDCITGESAIFEQGRFASNAQIVEDAQILSIPLALLKEQMRLNNQLAFNMLTSMIEY
jgi:CRP-like cAMP-binding protein